MTVDTLAIAISKTPPRKKHWYAKINWIGIGTLLFLLLLWELADRVGAINFNFIPAPSDMIGATGELVSEGALQKAILHTAGVALTGWATACVLGIAIGTALGVSRTLWRWTAASIEVLRSFPSITFVPLAVLLFGFSLSMELVVAILCSVLASSRQHA